MIKNNYTRTSTRLKTSKCCILRYIAILIFATTVMPLFAIASAQVSPSSVSINTLFVPLVYIQYGPSPDQGIGLAFRSAEFLNGPTNHTLNLYGGTTLMTINLTARPQLYFNDTVQPTFDSYFSFNR